VITSLIYFITALMALEYFGAARPPGFFARPVFSAAGTLLFILFTALVGYLRVRSLAGKAQAAFPHDIEKRKEIVHRWSVSFHLTIAAAYIGILWIFGWGYTVGRHWGLSGTVLLDEIAGLAPYGLLLIVYWSLAFVLQRKLSVQEWRYGEWIRFNANLTLVPAVPVFVFLAVFDLLYYLPYPLCLYVGTGTGVWDMLVVFLLLLLMGLFFPLFLVKLWRCSPLEPGPRRSLIEAVCRGRGLKYRDVVVWNVGEGKFLNAGIVGVIPRFRYVLFTRRLLSAMSDEELVAVLGHEIGHAKHHHILLNMIISFGFLAFLVVSSGVLGAGISLLFPGGGEALFFLAGVGLLVFYWRVVFGWISRRFERQADLYGVETAGGVDPMISALEKIAALSGHSRYTPNWTHYSIAQRVAFLESVRYDPAVASAFSADTRSFTRKLVAVAVLLFLAAVGFLGGGGQAPPPLQRWFADGRYAVLERYFLDRLERVTTDSERADVYNNIAWLYATSVDARFFRPYKALYYAKMAVSLTETGVNEESGPRMRERFANYLDTLAAAYSAVGDHYSAVYYAERAVAICPPQALSYGELVKNLYKYHAALRHHEITI